MTVPVVSKKLWWVVVYFSKENTDTDNDDVVQ